MRARRPELRMEERGSRGGFTLIELLVVIAIIGLLTALVAQAIGKDSVTAAAPRQMLDDCARARQLAISRRTTVFMVFIPTNFWGRPFNMNTSPWNALPPAIQTSPVVSQMYGAQWTGYYMESLRGVGDQPGQRFSRDLEGVRKLPAGSFIAPLKFTTAAYPNPGAPYPAGRSDLPIYGFPLTNNLPFPVVGASGGLWLPYVAFNYLGQLTPGDGSVLSYDENIPLAYGAISEPMDPNSKAPVRGFPNATQVPANNSMSISYNVIHIDHLTGRARLERQEAQ